MSKLVYGITPTLSHLALIAKDQNFFKKRNLDIDFRTFLTGRKATQALQKGWIDIANVIDANVAVLSDDKKTKVKLLSCTQRRKDGIIIGRPDLGITSPQSLIGKKLGYMHATSSHMFIIYFCRHHRIEIEQLNLVPVRTDQMQKELLSGNIDACSIWQPFTTHLKVAAAQADIDITYLKNENFFELYVIFAANRKSLKSRQDDVTAVEDALDEALDYSEKNPDHIIEILAKVLDIPPALLRDMQNEIALCHDPISHAFWEQVKIHLSWLNAEPSKDYEKFIDSLIN